jgi:hypothetical protein
MNKKVTNVGLLVYAYNIYHPLRDSNPQSSA